MTADEFNTKYKDYLEEGHYGLDIDIYSVVEYLDKEFQHFIKVSGFSYSQIKLKFGMARFYCSGPINSSKVESDIDELVKIDDEKNK